MVTGKKSADQILFQFVLAKRTFLPTVKMRILLSFRKMAIVLGDILGSL